MAKKNTAADTAATKIMPIRTPLDHRIDFVVVISCDGANPNGDPLGGNMPRTDLSGRGEISDVCIKHKVRNRLEAMFNNGTESSCDEILISPADTPNRKSSIDGRMSAKDGGALMEMVSGSEKNNYSVADKVMAISNAFRDVRSFGYVMATSGVSIGIRGPVSMTNAKTLRPVSPIRQQIVKCISTSEKDDGKKGSDTMGNRYRIDSSCYVLYGSISPTLAERTGFSMEDAEALKMALETMFDGDESSARPAGSMAVEELYWFEHNCKLGQYPIKAVHNSVKLTPKDTAPFFESSFDDSHIPGLKVTIEHPSL